MKSTIHGVIRDNEKIREFETDSLSSNIINRNGAAVSFSELTSLP